MKNTKTITEPSILVDVLNRFNKNITKENVSEHVSDEETTFDEIRVGQLFAYNFDVYVKIDSDRFNSINIDATYSLSFANEDTMYAIQCIIELDEEPLNKFGDLGVGKQFFRHGQRFFKVDNENAINFQTKEKSSFVLLTYCIVLEEEIYFCSCCGNHVLEGYRDTDDYYCSDNCLPYSEDEWENECEQYDECYWIEVE